MNTTLGNLKSTSETATYIGSTIGNMLNIQNVEGFTSSHFVKRTEKLNPQFPTPARVGMIVDTNNADEQQLNAIQRKIGLPMDMVKDTVLFLSTDCEAAFAETNLTVFEVSRSMFDNVTEFNGAYLNGNNDNTIYFDLTVADSSELAGELSIVLNEDVRTYCGQFICFVAS
ncbi:hypothetical protein [Vibrio sp. 10N.239.312.D08]|uniref:hypothetical protein n=1 Tax=Vibrio sp. 10N.239.312.D08 TaxID=3229978 RepID=UPI00354F6EBD